MKKLIKKLLKALLWFSVSVLGIILLYILFNLNIFHSLKPLTPGNRNKLVTAILKDSTDPFRYIADKFDTHAVVFLGELHKRKQDLLFFNNLIPYLYREKKITIIGWEFGAAEYQQEADSVVTAFEFDRKKAIAIMRKSMYAWCYEEYLAIFNTIWQLNKSIPAGMEKIRFLQLNKPYNPRRLYSSDPGIRQEEAKRNFDNTLPGIVEKEVIQPNKKILIYCGLHHSLTKFRTPKFLFIKDNGRAGQQLYEKYPEKVFQCCLLSPFPPRWFIYNELTEKENYSYVFPFEGVFNQLYDTLKRPFALNSSNSLFAEMKDHNSFYAFDTWGGIKLRNFCDGIIMLESFDKTEPVSLIRDWVTSQEETEEVKKILPETVSKNIKSPAELMQYISPENNFRELQALHQIKKFWEE